MERNTITEKLIKSKIVAVIRINEVAKLPYVAEALVNGGITALEVTLTIPNALDGIKELQKQFGDYILLGAGSVLNKEAAEQAIEAGANYIVSPIYKKEIIEKGHSFDKPVMTGAFSPTEIFTAYEAGADIVKVFPADALGMKYFKAIKGPMPMLKIMPTGGVDLTNVKDWLNAGACAVGVGGALVDNKAIDRNDFEILTQNAKTIIENLK